MLSGLLMFLFGIWLLRKSLGFGNKHRNYPTPDYFQHSNKPVNYSGVEEVKHNLTMEISQLQQLNQVVLELKATQDAMMASGSAESRELDAMVLQDSLAREARYKAVLVTLLGNTNLAQNDIDALLEVIESPETVSN